MLSANKNLTIKTTNYVKTFMIKTGITLLKNCVKNYVLKLYVKKLCVKNCLLKNCM